MSIFGRVMALEKRVDRLEAKVEAQEDMVINLAQTVAELSQSITEQTIRVDMHDDIIEHLDEHVAQLFNEAYQNAAKELSAGIDQVLNFTPYGTK